MLPALVSNWVAGDFAIYFTYALLHGQPSLCMWGHVGMLSLGSHAVYFGVGGACAMSVDARRGCPGCRICRGRAGSGSSPPSSLPAALPPGRRLVLLREPPRGAFFGIVTLALAFIVDAWPSTRPGLAASTATDGAIPPITSGLNGGAEHDPMALWRCWSFSRSRWADDAAHRLRPTHRRRSVRTSCAL